MKKLTVALLLCSCTTQECAAKHGGTVNVDVTTGQKVLGCTWKNGDDFWYLTRPMKADEQPEVLTFQEQSGWGVQQGKVTLHEHK